MTTFNNQLSPNPIGSPRLRDALLALIFAGAALYIFYQLLMQNLPLWIVEQLYPYLSFGSPLTAFSLHLASLVFFCGAVLLSRMLRVNILPLKFAMGTAYQLFICCAGVLVLFCLFHAALHVFKVPPSPWELDYVFTPNQGGLVLFNTTLLVPVNEELVFRGILPFFVMNLILVLASPFSHGQNPSLRDAALTVGMALSALVFAVMHGRGFVYDAYFLSLGLWFGYWACKTNGLLIPIISHAFAGLLAVGTIYIQNI